MKERFFMYIKYGELPSFGPPTPRRVLKLLGEHKDDFLKGRQCENQGLGKGSFTYYRNVVEKQKETLINGIINAAKILGVKPAQIAEMEAAKKEISFKKSIETIKNAIPDALLIKGHNPLTLLHSATSEGIHPSLTDEECLKYATAIRTILVALCEKIATVTRNDSEINEALKQLMGEDSEENERAAKPSAETNNGTPSD